MKRLGLTVDEYRRITGLSRNAAYAAIRAGDVPSIRVGSRIVIPRHAVEAVFGPVVLDDDPEREKPAEADSPQELQSGNTPAADPIVPAAFNTSTVRSGVS